MHYLWRFHKTASSAFIQIKAMLNRRLPSHLSALGDTYFSFSFSGVRSQPGSFLQHTKQQQQKEKMVTPAGPRRPSSALNLLVFPCGTYPYQLHNFDFRDKKNIPRNEQSRLGNTEERAQGDLLWQAFSFSYFGFECLWREDKRQKREREDVDADYINVAHIICVVCPAADQIHSKSEKSLLLLT